MSFFHDFFARFTATVRTIVAFVLPIAESSAGKIIAGALPLALTIVSNIATQGLKGNAATTAAVGKLKTHITQQWIATGTEIATSVLNLIVEMAVNHQKVQ